MEHCCGAPNAPSRFSCGCWRVRPTPILRRNVRRQSPHQRSGKSAMSSLFGALSIAAGALAAEQGAMDATTNNVANANTPGYSRLRPVLVESDPVVENSVTYGQGVTLQKLESVRDPILQLRIQGETQQQGQL